jgi:hypothetical protein
MLKTVSESKPEKYQLAVFDTRSEEVLPIMPLESSNPLGQLHFLPGSQYGFVLQEAPDGKKQLWLWNAAEGKVSKIAEADIVAGAVSTSDEWAVTNTADRKTKEVEINIIDLETGQVLLVGAGSAPVWVVP